MGDYKIERNAKHCRVQLAGDLTAATVPALRTALKAELDAGVREVVFDLAQTGMLDSSGIGVLIAVFNSLSASQGTLKVVNVSTDIFQLLQSMRLVARLNVTARATEMQHHG